MPEDPQDCNDLDAIALDHGWRSVPKVWQIVYNRAGWSWYISLCVATPRILHNLPLMRMEGADTPPNYRTNDTLSC